MRDEEVRLPPQQAHRAIHPDNELPFEALPTLDPCAK